ncbi:ATP-binding protein, partial [Acinetobacter sp. 207]
DNGHAVTDDVLARLGERFYRALGSKAQGSGLGLSICKKIIELHAGKIEFSRAEQGGLKVRILLPKAQL